MPTGCTISCPPLAKPGPGHDGITGVAEDIDIRGTIELARIRLESRFEERSGDLVASNRRPERDQDPPGYHARLQRLQEDTGRHEVREPDRKLYPRTLGFPGQGGPGREVALGTFFTPDFGSF